MSAFLVSEDCINRIVTSAVKRGIIQEAEATKLGKTLLRSNLKSLNARYGDPLNYKEVVTPYVYEVKEVDGNQAIMDCNCFDYQSCEYRSYDNSKACKFIDAIRLKELDGITLDAWRTKTRSMNLMWG